MAFAIEHETSWIDDMLVDHNQNWTVHTEPLLFDNAPKLNAKDEPEYFWTYRQWTDDEGNILRREPIAPVGSDYTPLQNREAFDFMNVLGKNGDLVFETFREYRDGRGLFMEARIPEPLKIAGEPITDRIIFYNGHDGHLTCGGLFSPTRDFCTNQLVYLLGRNEPSPSFKIKHTLNANQRLAHALRMLEEAKPYTWRIKELGEDLARQRFQTQSAQSLLKKIIPTPKGATQRGETRAENRRREILDVWRTSENLNDIRYTKWGFLQAITEWNDHYKNYASEDVRFDAVFRGRTLYKAAIDGLTGR